MLALKLHSVLLKIWLIFYLFLAYNSAVPCIVKFTGHLSSDEILLVVWEWEQEGMGLKIDIPAHLKFIDDGVTFY